MDPFFSSHSLYPSHTPTSSALKFCHDRTIRSDSSTVTSVLNFFHFLNGTPTDETPFVRSDAPLFGMTFLCGSDKFVVSPVVQFSPKDRFLLSSSPGSLLPGPNHPRETVTFLNTKMKLTFPGDVPKLVSSVHLINFFFGCFL